MKLNCPITNVPRNVPAVLIPKCQQVEQTPETDAHMAKKTFLSQVLLFASTTVQDEVCQK